MRFAPRRFPALCLLLLGSGAALTAASAATLYTWVDAQGVLHYSDTPHEGAEKIQVSGAQTFHNTPLPVTAPPTGPAPGAPTGAYVSCTITQPADGTALYAPETVDVAVQTQPSLQPGDYVSAAMDGQGLSADGTRLQIVQPSRGQHTVSAEVRSSDGTVLCTAAPVTFSVQRPSVNSPQSPLKPH